MEAYLAAIAVIALIYVLLSLGLNLQYGLTGLINFGHVGFFAIGAYASAILALRGVPLVACFAAAAALAGIAAWPIGLISLRLRDDYFAIVTLGFSEIVRLVVTSERWLTNGVQGIPGIPRLFASLEGPAAQLAPWRSSSPSWSWRPGSCDGSASRPSVACWRGSATTRRR